MCTTQHKESVTVDRQTLRALRAQAILAATAATKAAIELNATKISAQVSDTIDHASNHLRRLTYKPQHTPGNVWDDVAKH